MPKNYQESQPTTMNQFLYMVNETLIGFAEMTEQLHYKYWRCQWLISELHDETATETPVHDV